MVPKETRAAQAPPRSRAMLSYPNVSPKSLQTATAPSDPPASPKCPDGTRWGWGILIQSPRDAGSPCVPTWAVAVMPGPQSLMMPPPRPTPHGPAWDSIKEKERGRTFISALISQPGPLAGGDVLSMHVAEPLCSETKHHLLPLEVGDPR